MRDTGDRHHTTAYADESRYRYVTLYALQAVLQLREEEEYSQELAAYTVPDLEKSHDGSAHACLLEPLADGRYPVRDIRRRGGDGLDVAGQVAEALARAFDGAFVGVAGGREGRSQGVCRVEFSVYVRFAGGRARWLGEPRATIDSVLTDGSCSCSGSGGWVLSLSGWRWLAQEELMPNGRSGSSGVLWRRS